jgi:hypothetical protein
MKFQSSIVAGVLLLALFGVTGHSFKAGESKPKAFETRCGWLNNPTPGNIWFNDREAEWTIGVQGGYQVANDWPWPAFKRGEWVRTNAGSYGYGCACFQLRVNKETHEVVEIKSARARPLTQCRKDSSLKRWKMG